MDNLEEEFVDASESIPVLKERISELERERDTAKSDSDMYMQDLCEISDALKAPEGIPLQEVAQDWMASLTEANALLEFWHKAFFEDISGKCSDDDIQQNDNQTAAHLEKGDINGK